MILHVWMHWFWITSFSLECSVYFTVQMISIVTISHFSRTEAGLLDNVTLVLENSSLSKFTDSSQTESLSNVTTKQIDTSKDMTSQLPELLTLSSTVKTDNDLLEDQFEQNTLSSIMPDLENIDSEANENGTEAVHSLKKVMKNADRKWKVKQKAKANQEVSVDELKLLNISILEGDYESVHSEVKNISSTAGENFLEPKALPTESVITTLPLENLSTERVDESESHTTEVPVEEFKNSEIVSTIIPLTPNVLEVFDVNLNQKDSEKFKNKSLVIENKVEESRVTAKVESFLLKNRVAAAASAHNFEENQSRMNAGSVTGITLGTLVVAALFGAVSFVLYRRRYLNKPQVLQDKCSNLDSSGYIDDTSLRENSEEMYSLDNDSFLNSLEAMTIQNYWTENVKHTKF